MSASSWWDRSTGFALLTILLWASLAALTSRVTSVSPLVLVGLVLFYAKLRWVGGPGRIDLFLDGMVPVRTGLLLVDSLLVVTVCCSLTAGVPGFSVRV